VVLTRTNHDNAHIKYDIPCGGASNHPVQSMTPYAKKEKIRRKRKLFSARTVQFSAFFPVGGTALAAAVNSPRTKHDSSDDRGCLRWEGWYFASLEPQKLFEKMIGLFCSSSVLPPHSDMPCGVPSPQDRCLSVAGRAPICLRRPRGLFEEKDGRKRPRVCLGGSTPPFRASPKTPNVAPWNPKNFWENYLLTLQQFCSTVA